MMSPVLCLLAFVPIAASAYAQDPLPTNEWKATLKVVDEFEKVSPISVRGPGHCRMSAWPSSFPL